MVAQENYAFELVVWGDGIEKVDFDFLTCLTLLHPSVFFLSCGDNSFSSLRGTNLVPFLVFSPQHAQQWASLSTFFPFFLLFGGLG